VYFLVGVSFGTTPDGTADELNPSQRFCVPYAVMLQYTTSILEQNPGYPGIAYISFVSQGTIVIF
jgi:hypothetical protein